MKASVTSATFLGILVAACAMYVAWSDNPQCEIHCQGHIDWKYWLFIGASWFIVVFVSTFALVESVSFLVKRRAKNESAT